MSLSLSNSADLWVRPERQKYPLFSSLYATFALSFLFFVSLPFTVLLSMSPSRAPVMISFCLFPSFFLPFAVFLYLYFRNKAPLWTCLSFSHLVSHSLALLLTNGFFCLISSQICLYISYRIFFVNYKIYFIIFDAFSDCQSVSQSRE